MPWNEVTVMSQREEFVALARALGANISALCGRFCVSRKTGYKWLGRADEPDGSLADRARRPHRSPRRTAARIEAAVVAVRQEHEPWGARKIARRLRDLGFADVPAPSTITAILRRHGLISAGESANRAPMTRFERSAPNALWQMDFKGPVAMLSGPCHPLTVIDDHSRFAVCVRACGNESQAPVRAALIETFRLYGLPGRILCDNGHPWGSAQSRYTALGAWLIRLGIGISHGRAYHPQTQGKNERFNRTLGAEGIAGRVFDNLGACQTALDRFRRMYNLQRPHEALDLETPASRYRISPVQYPETLAPIVYAPGDVVRKVVQAGFISWGGSRYHIGRAFAGNPVAVRPTQRDGIFDVCFYHSSVAVIDVRNKTCRQN